MIADEGAWGYNFVSKWVLGNQKCVKKKQFIETWSCNVKPKQNIAYDRSKTHLSQLKCHVKKWFCSNLRLVVGKGVWVNADEG